MKIIILIAYLLISTAHAAQGFTSFENVLTAPNSRQAVSGTPATGERITIQNHASAPASIFLGGSDVTVSGSTVGIEITAGSSFTLETSPVRGFRRSFDITKLFLVTTGTGVSATIGIVTDN